MLWSPLLLASHETVKELTHQKSHLSATVRMIIIYVRNFPIICQITKTLKMLIIILMKCVVLLMKYQKHLVMKKGITKPVSLGLQFLPSKLQSHGRATWQKPTFKVKTVSDLKQNRTKTRVNIYKIKPIKKNGENNHLHKFSPKWVNTNLSTHLYTSGKCASCKYFR